MTRVIYSHDSDVLWRRHTPASSQTFGSTLDIGISHYLSRGPKTDLNSVYDLVIYHVSLLLSLSRYAVDIIPYLASSNLVHRSGSSARYAMQKSLESEFLRVIYNTDKDGWSARTTRN